MAVPPPRKPPVPAQPSSSDIGDLLQILQANETLTVAVYDPFAPFPSDDVKRVTGLLAIEKVVATRSDIDAVNKGFYELKTSLKIAVTIVSEMVPVTSA